MKGDLNKRQGEDVRLIPFYLPQYHEIPENNEWWGKGFTEWTNVKKAKKLFLNHYEPRIPLNENYYDLSDENVLVNQMNLAKKYGIYGFCFYHYWFNGKKLLEKPVEKILSNPNAQLPFCLSWANEPWTRTWNGEIGSKQILIDQDYGKQKEWKEHFMYLLPFFKDDRYITEDGKPVFLVYRAKNIPHCKEMFDYWRLLAVENGLKGLYLMQMNTGFGFLRENKIFDAVVDFEPTRTLTSGQDNYLKEYSKKDMLNKRLRRYYLMRKFVCTKISYETVCKTITSTGKLPIKKRYYGMFTGFDNSPRRQRKALIVTNSTPKLFEHYLTKQIERSKKENNNMLFINAWNEWGEGAYLEPDERYGFAYLQAIKRAKQKCSDN